MSFDLRTALAALKFECRVMLGHTPLATRYDHVIVLLAALLPSSLSRLSTPRVTMGRVGQCRPRQATAGHGRAGQGVARVSGSTLHSSGQQYVLYAEANRLCQLTVHKRSGRGGSRAQAAAARVAYMPGTTKSHRTHRTRTGTLRKPRGKNTFAFVNDFDHV